MATVLVKIAVAVDGSGKWNASGYSLPDSSFANEEAMSIAVEGVDDGEARYWVTAVLRVPETEPIEGMAESA